MWGARLLVAASIGGRSLGALPGIAQEWNPFRPDVRIWKGQVDVVLKGSEEVSDEKINEQSSYTFHETGIVRKSVSKRASSNPSPTKRPVARSRRCSASEILASCSAAARRSRVCIPPRRITR